MMANGSKRWIEALPFMIDAINKSHNRTLGKRPIDITEDNWYELWKKLYHHPPTSLTQSLIGVVDYVRISLPPKAFRKGYTPGFTNEVFRVHRALKSNPPTFVIKDQNNEILEGRFYIHELSLVVR